MISFLKRIRYKNLIMVFLTMVLTKYALIHSFVKNSYLTDIDFFTLIISILLITAGGSIVKDLFNVENKKPNKISKKKVYLCYVLLTSTGLILGIYLSISVSLLNFSFFFILAVLSLYFYSKYFKSLPFIGNLIVSLFTGFIIYIVYLFDFKYIEFDKLTQNKIQNATLFLKIWIAATYYSSIAFLATIVKEIIKDIVTTNRDLKIKAKTLPILFGRKRASKVAFFFSAILFIFILISLQLIKNEALFFVYGIVFILFPLGYFMYQLWIAETEKDFYKLIFLIKFIMISGLLSMILFRID